MQGAIRNAFYFLYVPGKRRRGPHNGAYPRRAALRQLEPVFAGAFHPVAACLAATAGSAMAVMAMSATLSILCWLQVAYWDFLRILFAHITFLASWIWVVSVRRTFLGFGELTLKL
jgi:hypothetical protein